LPEVTVSQWLKREDSPALLLS